MSLAVSNRLPADHPDLAAAAAAAIEADGYVIVTDVLDAAECSRLVDEIGRVEDEHDIREGTNEFEGFSTRRIFDLISKSEPFRAATFHPSTLPIMEAVLGRGLLLSGTTSMNIGPGETPQLLHADDGMVTLPRPHPATMLTSLWALSDFRPENGGTHFVPGSHRFESTPQPGDSHEVARADMPAGSVLILHGSTWHGGGGNATAAERRFGVSIQYVAGWCRQQQNLMLGTPLEVVASYPPELRALIGYSLFRKVMGHVNREHPLTLIGESDPATDMVWDRMKP